MQTIKLVIGEKRFLVGDEGGNIGFVGGRQTDIRCGSDSSRRGRLRCSSYMFFIIPRKYQPILLLSLCLLCYR